LQLRACAASATGWIDRSNRVIRFLIALVGALALVLPFAAADSATPVQYEAPAQKLPAGHLGGDPFWAVLPSGRLVKPAGRSALVGTASQAVALVPNSHYAIVAGDSLSVVDTESMMTQTQFVLPEVTAFTSVLAMRDPVDPTRTLVVASSGSANAIYFFTLDGDKLVASRFAPKVQLVGFPIALVPGANDTVYAIAGFSGRVTAIDLRTRRLRATRLAGFFPVAGAFAGSQMLVCNEGAMQYAHLDRPAQTPPYQTPPGDMDRASSLSFLNFGPSAADPPPLRMDRPPDGIHVVGGAHPRAIAVTPDGAYAFVAMANVDRVAVVALDGTPRVTDGLELRLFPKGPYGTQPTALALSRDGKRLYVALAGIDAVAVLDASSPLNLKRLGLIPTGDDPVALALADDDRTLLVVNAKGFGPNGTSLSSTLQRIDLSGINLVGATYATLGATRIPVPARSNALVPALGSGHPSSRIKHVFLILQEDKTFDSVLGDLVDLHGKQHGNGARDLAVFGAAVTPNLHALARNYAIADNFYADARSIVEGHQLALGGEVSDYSQMQTLEAAPSREDPEGYARFGYIFNTLAVHGISYRDYGDLLLLRGYDRGDNPDPRVDDPSFAGPGDRVAPTMSLGGLYASDAPAIAALRGHVDERYPGWNLRIRDERRAREFVRDFDALVAAGKAPRYTVIWLPSNHGGAGKDIPPYPEEVADGDRALGIIVSHLTRLPLWKDSAIFVMPADSQSQRDHVSTQRSFALVVSPYAKRGYVGHRHLATVSVLKTEEEILGIPPLSLRDLLATDMADFFTSRPNFAPYTAKAVSVPNGE
jgi:DNA-binding beta-propeller fold protein YncE